MIDQLIVIVLGPLVQRVVAKSLQGMHFRATAKRAPLNQKPPGEQISHLGVHEFQQHQTA